MKKILAAALALLLCLSACSAPAGDAGAAEHGGDADGAKPGEEAPVGPKSPVEGRTVVFVSGSADDPFFSAAAAGARHYAEQWGLDLRNAEGWEQADAVQQAIDLGADGVCVCAADAEALAPELREARKAGLAVTTWYSDVAPDARTLTVSQGTAEMLGPMLVEMGAASLRERGVDPAGEVRFVWHLSEPADAGQRAWYDAGLAYIDRTYSGWTAAAEPYASAPDADSAAAVGGALLDEAPDADLILCCGAAALEGQCRAAQERGLTAENVTITGFCPRAVMLPYLEAGVCARWGLWDCGMQAAMACYLAAWLAAGNSVRVGDVVSIPRIGSMEILPNSALVPEQETADADNGVVLLPERVIFTAENVADDTWGG